MGELPPLLCRACSDRVNAPPGSNLCRGCLEGLQEGRRPRPRRATGLPGCAPVW